MPSTKQYLEFILQQLSGIDAVSYKPMMGEYVLYFKGKIIGGIYDNRFLVKPIKSAKRLMPEAAYETPYSGAKDMLLVDNVDDFDFLKELLEALYADLPESKTRTA